MVEACDGVLPARADDQLVSVYTYESPLRQARRETTAPEGLTVAQILEREGFPHAHPGYHVLVLIGGEPVPERMFHHVRPRAGTNLTASIVPHGGGGGKGILGILLGILMVVAAVFTAGAALGGLAGIGALIGTGATVGGMTLGTALGTLAAGIAGTVAGVASIASGIMSLVSPPPSVPMMGKGAAEVESYAILGVRNNARPFKPIPTVFGTYRMFPPHLATPYTETVGNDTFYRALLTFGYGPVEITDLKVGDRSFADAGLVEGTDYVLHQGFTDDTTEMTLFADDVDEANPSPTPQLEDGPGYASTMNNGEWHQMTSTADPTELSVDVVFPQGLFSVDDYGNALMTSVWIKVEFRASDMGSGAGAWQDPVLTSSFGEGVWTTKDYSANVKFSMKERGRIVRGARFDTSIDGFTPVSGQTYDVRIRRTNSRIGKWDDSKGDISTTTGGSNDGAGPGIEYDQQFHDCYWSQLRSIRPHKLSPVKNLSKIELRLKATETFNGQIDTVNAVVKSILPKYDPSTSSWGTGSLAKSEFDAGRLAVTNNPAWCFAHVLRGPQNSSPILDSQIDTQAIYNWAVACDNGTVAGAEIGSTSVSTLATNDRSQTVTDVYITNGDSSKFNGESSSGAADGDILNIPLVDGTFFNPRVVSTSAGSATYDTLNLSEGFPETGQTPDMEAGVEITTLPDVPYKQTFNGVVDFSTNIRKLLDDIAGSARASFNIVDGKYSVVVDQKRPQVVQHFTPRNSSNFEGERNYSKKIHAIRANFVNPDLGYKPDERVVYNDGYALTAPESNRVEFTNSKTGWFGFYGQSSQTAQATYMAVQENKTGGGGHLWGCGVASIVDEHAGGATPSITEPSTYDRVRVRIRKGVDHSSASPAITNRAWDGRLLFSSTRGGTAYNLFQNETVRNDVHSSVSGAYGPEPMWTEGKDGWMVLEYDCSDNTDWTDSSDISQLWFQMTTWTSSGTPSPLPTWEVDYVAVGNSTIAAEEFKVLDLWGCTDSAQAYRDARYHMASHQTRPEFYTLETDMEHLACTRGDRVRVSHDVMAVGYGGARMTSIVTDTSGGAGTHKFISGVLDEEFVYKQGFAYAMYIRQDPGSSVGKTEVLIPLVNQHTTDNGGASNIVISRDTGGTAIEDSAFLTEGCLVVFGEEGKESGDFIVMKVAPKQDLAATLTLIDYNEGVYDAGAVPEFVSNTSVQTLAILDSPPVPSIGDIIHDETVMNYTGAVPTPRISIGVSVDQGDNPAIVSHFTVQYQKWGVGDPTDENALFSEGAWRTVPTVEKAGRNTTVLTEDVETGETYRIRARSFCESNNTASEWTEPVELPGNDGKVIGGSTLPPDPTAITMRGTDIVWDYPVSPPDFRGFRVKYQSGTDSNWNTGGTANDGFLADSHIAAKSIGASGNQTVMVKAVDFFGNESANAASATFNLPASDTDNVVRTKDYRSQSTTNDWEFATYTNCSNESGVVEADDSGTTFWAETGTSTYWQSTGSADFWTAVYKAMTLELQGYDAYYTADLSCRMLLFHDIEGDSYQIEYANYETSGFSDWRPWVGELVAHNLINTAGNDYDRFKWRITIGGGPVQGKVKQFNLKTDRPTIEERFTNVAINNTIGIRIAPTKSFDVINSVVVTILSNTDGKTFDASDYNASTGPLVKVYQGGSAIDTASVDVVLRGY